MPVDLCCFPKSRNKSVLLPKRQTTNTCFRTSSQRVLSISAIACFRNSTSTLNHQNLNTKLTSFCVYSLFFRLLLPPNVIVVVLANFIEQQLFMWPRFSLSDQNSSKMFIGKGVGAEEQERSSVLKMKAVYLSETLPSTYKSTLSLDPEEDRGNLHRRMNPKSLKCSHKWSEEESILHLD